MKNDEATALGYLEDQELDDIFNEPFYNLLKDILVGYGEYLSCPVEIGIKDLIFLGKDGPNIFSCPNCEDDNVFFGAGYCSGCGCEFAWQEVDAEEAMKMDIWEESLKKEGRGGYEQ